MAFSLPVVDQQLAFVLLAFFTYQVISSSDSPLAGALPPTSQTPSRPTGNENAAMPPEMANKLDKVQNKTRSQSQEGEKIANSEPRGQRETPREERGKGEGSGEKSGSGGGDIKVDKGKAREANLSPHPTGLSPRTLRDLTPDQRQKYELAKARKEAEARATSPAKGHSALAREPVGLPERKVHAEGKAGSTQPDLSRTPTRLQDLTPEQQERYKRALAAKKVNTAPKSSIDATMGIKAPGYHSTEVQSDPAKRRERVIQDEKPKKRFQDMTDEEREKYMELRVARKDAEKRAARAGNMSGMTFEEKQALVSPA